MFLAIKSPCGPTQLVTQFVNNRQRGKSQGHPAKRISLSPKLSTFLKPSSALAPPHLRRSISSSSLSLSPPPPQPTSPKPKTPLFLRPPIHPATTSDLQQWHHWAKTLASSVGSSFADSENGPDSTLLLRELKWLVDDAVHQENLENGEGNIRLRVSLEEMYLLWKQRIEERSPFQYVVGCEHWRELVLCVQEGVLIPRPETELVVDLVGEAVEGNEGLREGLWADLGTGSGAIAIGIARVLGSCGRVFATDLSPVAVSVAGFNVKRYGLQDVVKLRQGSWFEPLKDVEGELAGFVSNPPYIPSDNISGLQAEVGRHEPRVALDGGVDGMDDLLHLCRGAASMLRPGGFFSLETNGESQCKYLVDYMENEARGSFCNLSIIPDFAGIHRFVTGFRK